MVNSQSPTLPLLPTSSELYHHLRLPTFWAQNPFSLLHVHHKPSQCSLLHSPCTSPCTSFWCLLQQTIMILWLKWTKIYPHTVLEVRNPQSVPPGWDQGYPFLPLLSSGGCRQSLACDCITPSVFVVTVPSLLCVCQIAHCFLARIHAIASKAPRITWDRSLI